MRRPDQHRHERRGERHPRPRLPQFAPLVKRTAQHFTINEMSADKANLSKQNLRVVAEAGGTAYIPFKSNSVLKNVVQPRDSLWERAYQLFHLNRAAFLDHYHKRSNVETTFATIKAKFGGAVRSKTPVAQVNEVLVKILCHNVCCYIQSAYEMGVDPTFGTELTAVPEVG